MTSKKQEIMRIILFYVLAIVPILLIAAVSSDGFTNKYWADMENNQSLVTVAGLWMLAPALAVLLTRLITKEGFGEEAFYGKIYFVWGYTWYLGFAEGKGLF